MVERSENMALSVVNRYKIVQCGVEIAASGEEHARDGEPLALTTSREEGVSSLRDAGPERLPMLQ